MPLKDACCFVRLISDPFDSRSNFAFHLGSNTPAAVDNTRHGHNTNPSYFGDICERRHTFDLCRFPSESLIFGAHLSLGSWQNILTEPMRHQRAWDFKIKENISDVPYLWHQRFHRLEDPGSTQTRESSLGTTRVQKIFLT